MNTMEPAIKFSVLPLSEGYVLEAGEKEFAIESPETLIQRIAEVVGVDLSDVLKTHTKQAAAKTHKRPGSDKTVHKVKKLALEQIEITGKLVNTKIADELGISSATVSYHLDNLEKEISEAKETYQDSRETPMINNDTRPAETGLNP